MGTLADKSIWENAVYRIQVTDPILGGSDGIVNIQPSQIANRTQYLLGTMGAEHPLGRHQISDEQISPDARIAENKLDLDISIPALLSLLTHCQQSLDVLQEDVAAVIGPDGTKISSLSQAVQLLWQYSLVGFDFELFTGNLTMRDINNRAITSTVSGDDTIICNSTAGISVGNRLLICAMDGSELEEVTIRSVLSETHLLAESPLQITRTSGYLGHMSWVIIDGAGLSAPKSVYLSHISKVLAEVPSGKLIIRRDSGTGILKVQYRILGTDNPDWVTCVIEANEATDDGYYDESYSIPGGYLQLRIQNDSPKSVVIQHMALFPVNKGRYLDAVKQPSITCPGGNELYTDEFQLCSSTCRTAYGDNLEHTEFRLVSTENTEDQLLLRASRSTEVQLAEQDVHLLGMYALQCRHITDMGDMSPWSTVRTIQVKIPTRFFGFEGTRRASTFNDQQYYNLQYEKIRFGFAGVADAAGFEEALFILER